MESHYDVLGCSPTADKAALRLAYRRAARAAHPDFGSGDQVQMAKVNLAWEVLGDPAKRSSHDAMLRAARDAAARARATAGDTPPRPHPPRPGTSAPRPDPSGSSAGTPPPREQPRPSQPQGSSSTSQDSTGTQHSTGARKSREHTGTQEQPREHANEHSASAAPDPDSAPSATPTGGQEAKPKTAPAAESAAADTGRPRRGPGSWAAPDGFSMLPRDLVVGLLLLGWLLRRTPLAALIAPGDPTLPWPPTSAWPALVDAALTCGLAVGAVWLLARRGAWRPVAWFERGWAVLLLAGPGLLAPQMAATPVGRTALLALALPALAWTVLLAALPAPVLSERTVGAWFGGVARQQWAAARTSRTRSSD